MNIIPLSTLDLKGLELYRSMKGKPFPLADRYFVAEGEKMVSRLLKSTHLVESILLSPRWLERYRPIIEERPEKDLAVYVGEEKLLAEITGIQMHQCIMAMARVPPPLDVARYMASLEHPPLLVALDGIVDAENMGGIVRNCVAFGVDLLLYARNCCSPYLRRAARVSMGGIFNLPMVRVDRLAACLRGLAGIRLIATKLDPSSAHIDDLSYRDGLCLVFGSEGSGISREVLDVCTEQAWIPMLPHVDSLNVAASCGIFLYEAWRSRASG